MSLNFSAHTWPTRHSVLDNLMAVAKKCRNSDHLLNHGPQAVHQESFLYAVGNDLACMSNLDCKMHGTQFMVDGAALADIWRLFAPHGMCHFLVSPDISSYEQRALTKWSVDVTQRNVLMARLATIRRAFDIQGNIQAPVSSWTQFLSTNTEDGIKRIFDKISGAGVMRFTFDTDLQC